MAIKNQSKFIGLVLNAALVLFVSSCNENNPISDKNSIADVFKQSATTPQSFTVNAGINSSIIGSQGTIVNIPANSFETMTGSAVTGNITFYLTEVYDNNEMIFNQKPTIASSQMLVSGGVVNLAAYQGSNKLVLNNDINVLMPTSNTTNSPSSDMQIFNWERNDSTSNPLDSTWVPQDSIIVPVDSGWVFDSGAVFNSGIYYNLVLGGLGWINCDAYYNQGELATIDADAPTGYSDSDTRVFVILTSLNTFIELHSYGCSTYEFCHNGYVGLPVGYSYAVAAIHYDSGTTSYSSSILSGLTIAPISNVVTLNFSATTIAQFEAAVLAL